MKFIYLLALSMVLLTLVYAGDQLSEARGVALYKISDVSKNTDRYAEMLGVNFLKFQNFFMGGLEFISLGAFQKGGTLAFVQFLFMALIFMLVYSVSPLSDSLNLLIALCVTLIGFIGLDSETLETIFVQYGSTGLIVSVILPVLILLAFTFRIYQRAYEGKSKTSPFYAEVFNFIFLVFFGIFFIRHSSSEEGVVASMRFVSGWVLIGLGVGQTLLYKLVAGLIHGRKNDDDKLEREMEKIDKEAADKINKVKARLDI